MYLLDTNHCSRIIQGNLSVLQRLRELGDATIATSVIVCGELRYMARKSDHEQANLEKVEDFLKIPSIYGINVAVSDIYGSLKGDIINRLGPRDKAQRRKFRVQNLGVSDNDLWIASTAIHYGLTIVSSDSDFQRIRLVADFPLENWMQEP